MVVYYAFTDKSGAFTLDNVTRLTDYTSTFLRSLWFGIVATIICLLIAYPLAYILSRMKLRAQSTMVMLVMIPMWMNFLLRTYAWMTLLEDSGVINSILARINIGPFHMINTSGAVILGMVYNFLPYMILPIYSVMTKLDNSLVEAAQDLGANRFHIIKDVVFPSTLSGVVSGVTMVFVPSVSTFYISQKLGSTGTTLIGDVIESQFKTAYNPNLGAAMSLVLMILIFICVSIMNHFGENEEEEVMAKV